MGRVTLWKNITNYSTCILGVVLIINVFFKRYIIHYITAIMVIEGVLLTISLLAELIYLYYKRKLK